MLYTSEDQKNKKQESFDGRAVNDLGPVTCQTNQKVLLIFFYIITLFIYYFVCHINKKNKVNEIQNKINQSASGIEVQLQKRFDTLTKLVDAVKGNVEFNKEVYENITKFRSHYKENDLNEQSKTLNDISSGISLAFENYPSLGADESIRKLMNEATIIEKEIAAARRLYNADVTSFNTTIYNFPMNVILSKQNYHGLNLFKVEEQATKDVKINLK